MAVVPSVIATLVSTYTPPFLGVPTTSTTAPSPPPTAPPSDPTVPALTDGKAWITAYLLVHRLSSASYRYAYLLWIVILFFGLLFALLHWTGFRGGPLGAAFDKWAYRRRTWRKKAALRQLPYRQPRALPSNAQLLALLILLIGPIALSFVGADYIKPGTPLWDLGHSIVAADTATATAPQYTIGKSWWTSGDRLGLIAFALFPLSVLLALKTPPFALFALPILTSLHFDKLTRLHKWCGRVIYLLTVGHVVAWSVQLARDKQDGVSSKSAWSFVFLYQDFIYALIAFGCFTLLILLSLGPIRERFYETFKLLHYLLVPLTLVFSALHYPPLGAWCYAALGLWAAERVWRAGRGLWVNGAFGGRRRKEETLGKGRYQVPTPYIVGQEWAPQGQQAQQGPQGRLEPWQLQLQQSNQLQQRQRDNRASYVSDREKPLPVPGEEQHQQQAHAYPPARQGRRSDEDSFTDSISEYYQYDATPVEGPGVQSPTKQGFGQHSPSSSVDLMVSRPGPRGASLEYAAGYQKEAGMVASSSSSSSRRAGYAATPAGFAHAVALPGRTVRLTLQTARPLTWAPGQHVLLRIPALSRFTMHPFTIASCCDRAERSELVLVIRARKGFTKQLWSYVYAHSGPGRSVAETLFTSSGRPKRGILLKATVDGPCGSAERARWGENATIVIIVGGSGVSFGTAIMEYVCLCLRGREGKSLGGRATRGGFRTDRVRFVWTVREYSHIQWAAPIIRRCLDMMPRNALQVDIFVTNGMKNPISQASTDLRTMAYQSEVFGDDASTLAPPVAQFAKPGRVRTMSNASASSVDSAGSDSSVADLDYASDEGGRLPRRLVPTQQREEEEPHILDMTNFDYEDDTRMPGEAQLSQKVRKEGKVRRAISRRVTNAAAAKREPRSKAHDSAGSSLLPYDQGSPTKESPPPVPPNAPPSSYRPPGAPEPASNRPRSFYPPGHPGRRSDNMGPYEQEPRYAAVSSADMYADGTDPLSFGPPAPVRPPRAQRSPMPGATPTDERQRPFPSAYVEPSDPYRHDFPGSSSSVTLQQYNSPYDQPYVRPTHTRRESTQSSLYTMGGTQTPSLYAYDTNYDARTPGAGESVRSLVDRKGQSFGPSHHRSESKVEMDDWEADDLNVVSEMARPGRPKLDRILADEVERAHGTLAVACCGPSSLNAMVRKLVAAQISPARLLRGDKRGRITLVTEDFEW
ncbi:hypothetical protein CALCODRAFT_481890 [Calocera cornea HHB12733]|uniref:ferric-chelate reductase (NADPH) n=1 Tax=Calocera cornea HHB12733 TaxID=1353952 RepID=A0A165H7N7_9BASI|nr:hypothetical protein CALCODRAFT_481890 [Calocera cornea HHB12733]